MPYHKLKRRPVKPWKNLEECKKQNGTFLLGRKSKEWPCYVCFGRGSVYPSNAVPDPVEGMKMVDLITCTHCKGTCVTNRKDFITHVFRPGIEEWRKELSQWRRDKHSYVQAVKKLTRHERILLGV